MYKVLRLGAPGELRQENYVIEVSQKYIHVWGPEVVFLVKKKKKPRMAMGICNSSAWEADTDGASWLPSLAESKSFRWVRDYVTKHAE